eukprot:CAMPEP_0179068832 /NCGR_PEP_ID=MMETSP0796-20121207/30200_1 /TAXON_ID=73915 /ORGANISM="Pyrodinium bahamense, Strain pbaha01" /LENGTH=62 /DNA_ID=CAMNT_0020765889 /DNA_START=174 /DNA_END=359 /DNA_ORIENTATION=+
MTNAKWSRPWALRPKCVEDEVVSPPMCSTICAVRNSVTARTVSMTNAKWRGPWALRPKCVED